MVNILQWISENPGAFASLISATIAASIALTVFALTQFISYRRERTQFLAPKLEELYLLLNETSEDNARFFKLVARASIGEKDALNVITTMEESTLYGLARAKRIIMYVRLYFPKLTTIHVLVFRAQQEFNDLTYQACGDEPPEIKDLVNSIGDVSHCLSLMEEEIIRNRDVLLSDYFFWKRYENTSKAALERKRPAPDGLFEELVISEIVSRTQN